jgi:hypothetical protein
MKNKVKTMQEAYRVFELLGIKDVTKPWQKRKGTEVWELPFKSMYQNGQLSINRFSIYRNGYVRKMIVYGENNASQSCYQLNLVRKVANFVKDYKWNDSENEMIWTGKYRKIYNNERIMIDSHRDRVIYLCNYILKNYYNNKRYNLVGEYTRSRVEIIHREWWKKDLRHNQLPFFDGDEHELALEEFKKIPKESFTNVDDIQVIINGHRYNLV